VPSYSLALRCDACDGAKTLFDFRWKATDEAAAWWDGRLGCGWKNCCCLLRVGVFVCAGKLVLRIVHAGCTACGGSQGQSTECHIPLHVTWLPMCREQRYGWPPDPMWMESNCEAKGEVACSEGGSQCSACPKATNVGAMMQPAVLQADLVDSVICWQGQHPFARLLCEALNGSDFHRISQGRAARPR